MRPQLVELCGEHENLGKLTEFVCCRINECMKNYMSKEETVKFIDDTCRIQRRFTKLVWDILEFKNPDFFSSYKTSCENVRNALKPDNKRKERWSKAQKAKEQQRQRSLSPFRWSDNAPNDASSEVPQQAAVSSKAKRRSEARKKAKELQRQQQQAPAEQVHKLLLRDEVGQLISDMEELKKQPSGEQVRGGYEEAETLQDPNQQLQQEMQRMDIPGNEGSDNSSEGTLYD